MTVISRSSPVEVSVVRGAGRLVEAYAAMFGTPYEVRDQHGHYMEIIERAAFDNALRGPGRPMYLYNHGMSVVDGRPDSLAGVPIGSPVEVKPDQHGLWTVSRMNKSPLGDAVLEAIKAGDIESYSFRGSIVRSSNDDSARRSGGLRTITRHELGLTDYGPTPIPVNAGAEILAVRAKARGEEWEAIRARLRVTKARLSVQRLALIEGCSPTEALWMALGLDSPEEG